MSNEVNSLIVRDEAARETVRHDLSNTLFVEAGAGTGKTTALVERILNLVLAEDDNVRRPLSQIAAITFTEAAAAELRERIRAKFEEALFQAEDPVLVKRCEEALADADVAAIQTLHGFAQRLLSEYPVEVGIPPRVEVIDEVLSQLAFDDRWSEFLDSLYEDPQLEEFIIRAAILGVSLNGPELRNVADVFDDNWDRLLDVNFTNLPAVAIDFDPLREVMAQVDELETLCKADDDKLLLKIRDLQDTFGHFRRTTSEHERLRIVTRLTNQKFGRSGTKGNWGDDVEYARSTCKSLPEVCAAILETVASQTLTQLGARIAEFTVESAAERRAEGLLEFHDLLVLAQRLLRTSAEAREGLAKRYRVLMLDEFQDTDPIQINLAMLLASAVTNAEPGDWHELEAEAGRLFMVGDPKQSIYRFRRADITLFLAARDKFAAGSVSLQQNFRTVEPIIAAVNGLFSEIMHSDTDSQAKYSPLIATRSPKSGVDHRPLIFGAGRDTTASEIREEEAAEVAAVISDVLAKPEQWPVEDPEAGWRAPQLSDITILLPTRTSMSQLSAALDARGIPFRADTGTLVYETQEVKDLLSVLRAIDDPSDEIATVTALRSALYGAGYDDLHTFRAGGGRFSSETIIPDALAGSVVGQGLAHLRDLKDRKWWDEPSELLVRLIDERYAMALPAHGRRARDTWRRLRYVVDQARAFAEAGGGDLRSYLEWTSLQGVDGSRAHEPMLPEPDDVAVQIMTIHGSKGLEFPITIVSGMTTGLSSRNTSGKVVWGKPGQLPEIRANSSVKTARFDQQKELDSQMDEPERERLLYVALTRARDHLVVSGFHPLSKDGSPRESYGTRVHTWATEAGADLVRRWDFDEQDQPAAVPTIEPVKAADVPMLATPSQWLRDHGERLAAGGARSTISATELARVVAAGETGDTGLEEASEHDGGVDDDKMAYDDEADSDGLPPRVFRRGRAGTAIGSAVHGTLQLLDLTNPTDSEVDSLSESQAWAESVPEHLETIRKAVRSALSADIVQACRTLPHHKELYVAAPVGELTVEGYVDLLVETADGLVVVDYKTDSVSNEAEVDAKLAHYGLQGTAYALAIESATGLSVADVQFIFARPEGPIVRSVPDLEADRTAILTALNGVNA